MLTKHSTTLFLGALVSLGLSVACDAKDSSSPEAVLRQTATFFKNFSFKYANNPAREQRITFIPGFSFLPPQGENWIEGPRQPEPEPNDYRVVSRMNFIRLLPQNEALGPHSVGATVFTANVPRQDRATKPEEYMRYRLRMIIAGDKVQAVGKFKLESQKGEVDRTLGYDCFRYEVIGENSGVIGYRGIPFKTDVRLMECLAPSGEFVVRMIYGQMVPPGEEPIDMTSEGEGFFKSLQFLTDKSTM